MNDREFIRELQRADAFPHECREFQLLETHISWVLLTGDFAYKIKKPVDLGFADFSSLAKRKLFCEEELRLNRRLAPDLYLKVSAITDSRRGPEVDGDGAVIDYAVCMRQFDQQRLLSRSSASLVTTEYVTELADTVAKFHQQAAVAGSDTRFGTANHILEPVRENFQTLMSADESVRRCVTALLADAEDEFDRLKDTFETRRLAGMIRECHGDLHLGNMFLQDGRIYVFDGIDFSEDLRWIDIVNDIAFAVMDFTERGYPQLARRFLNRWLESTGDYDGVAVLPFYCAYRAAVRAKIDLLRLQQKVTSSTEQRHLCIECCDYLELARRFTQRHRPALIITTGVSGSGKTSVTQRLIEEYDVIRVRSDVERKRARGMTALQRPDESSDDMYSMKNSRMTYETLANLASTVISSEYPVVVDAAFLRADHRLQFQRLAGKLGAPFLIIRCEAKADVLRNRIQQRRSAGNDASDADVAVLQQQLDHRDQLSPSEQLFAVAASDSGVTRVIAERAGLTH